MFRQFRQVRCQLPRDAVCVIRGVFVGIVDQVLDRGMARFSRSAGAATRSFSIKE